MRKRALIPACLFIAAYLLFFAGAGVRAPFTADDVMNLHRALMDGPGRLASGLIAVWTPVYRPLGGLVYAGLYRAFGFDPLPFRIFCFGLLFVNIGLLYFVSSRLADSREAGVLTAIIACYHAWLVDLYWSTGTIYELLCYAFYFGAFAWYIRARGASRRLSPLDWAIVLGLFICALDSKEMAVTLPVAILVYEWIYHRVFRGATVAICMALITVPFVLGRAGALTHESGYNVDVSAGRFIHGYHLYLNLVFYQDHFFRDATEALLLAAMLVLAIRLKSRPLQFAWCFVLFSVLPFIFLKRAAGFFIYFPLAGWAMYAAVVLLRLRDSVLQSAWKRIPEWAPAATVVAVALLLAPAHARETRRTRQVFASGAQPIMQLAGDLKSAAPNPPAHARFLLVNDTFPKDSYSPVFIARLLYRDMTIEVDRAPVAPPPDAAKNWYAVITPRKAYH